jgi:hypothetical protein
MTAIAAAEAASQQVTLAHVPDPARGEL